MPRPKVRNPSCSGEKSAILADFSTAATPPTAGRTSGTVGLRSRRTACDSSITPSPATLNVPGTSVWTQWVRMRIRSTSCTNCSRGSKPRTVGITGSRKYDVIGLSTWGPSTLASRSVVTLTSGRRRAKPRT